jgi:hypothetical protein
MISDRRFATCRLALVTGFLLLILIFAGCQSKEDGFDDYLGHFEKQVDRVVKDEVRAKEVKKVMQLTKMILSNLQPEYREISERIHLLAVAHPHDAAAYEEAHAASDALMDTIWDQLMELSREYRSIITEKEWKKLSDPDFYFEFTKYLKEGN